jgi:hypothetical protein
MRIVKNNLVSKYLINSIILNLLKLIQLIDNLPEKHYIKDKITNFIKL